MSFVACGEKEGEECSLGTDRELQEGKRGGFQVERCEESLVVKREGSLEERREEIPAMRCEEFQEEIPVAGRVAAEGDREGEDPFHSHVPEMTVEAACD